MEATPTYSVSRRNTNEDTEVNNLTNEIETPGKYPVAHGGYSDIHLGIWKRNMDGMIVETKVAVKFIRAFTRSVADPERAQKRLNREVYVWTKLEHPNIAQFFGVTFHMGGRSAIVMLCYLKSHPDTDKISLIKDIANGLQYLHTSSPPVVHGDLKGSNTLVTDEGRVVVTDFGLSKVIEELTGPSGNTTTSIGGSSRWQAPELLFDEEAEENMIPAQGPNTSSDIWAFGCVIYELLTGRLPYEDRSQEWSVILDIVQRKARPIRSEDHIIHSNPAVKQLMEDCWRFKAVDRPHIAELVKKLDTISLE
ncbi:kinase-like domain-containing protein [Cyathus striatus]|nr:kinase-like domain-containing protein [Cyathus striatus]